jgi:hypothetical protein
VPYVLSRPVSIDPTAVWDIANTIDLALPQATDLAR